MHQEDGNARRAILNRVENIAPFPMEMLKMSMKKASDANEQRT